MRHEDVRVGGGGRPGRLGTALLAALLLAACSSSEGGGGSGGGNRAPVASAGAAQAVFTAHLVTLDGSSSRDPDGDVIGYAWRLTARPDGSAAALAAATTANPTFTPDLAGTYVAHLVVSDGDLVSAPADVTITAAMEDLPPVADAGPAQYVTVGTLATLDGSGSHDSDGEPITYAWSFASVPGGSALTSLTNPTTVSPSFTPDVVGTFVVQLVVSDPGDISVPASVNVISIPANFAPVANAGPDQGVATGATVQLDGSGSSDADADPLTYSWSFASLPAGSAAALSDPALVNPTFVADHPGEYVVQLVVSDGIQPSAASTVAVAVGSTTSLVPTFAMFQPYLASSVDTGAGTNNNFVAQAAVVGVPPINFWNPSASRLRLHNSDGSTYAINYNGSSVTGTAPFAPGDVIPVASITGTGGRYVSVPYSPTGPVRISIRYTDSSACVIGTNPRQIIATKADGTVLAAQSSCDAASPLIVTATDAANAEVFVLYSRITDSSGGLRVWQVDVTK